MERKDDVTVRTLARISPVRFLLLAVGPAVLAGGQLLNSYVNGLSLPAAVAFAVLMVGFSVMYTRFRLAEVRLRTLERTARPAAD